MFYNELKADDVFPSAKKSDQYVSGQELHLLQYEGDDATGRKCT